MVILKPAPCVGFHYATINKTSTPNLIASPAGRAHLQEESQWDYRKLNQLDKNKLKPVPVLERAVQLKYELNNVTKEHLL